MDKADAWWEIRLFCSEPEETAAELISQGASGAQLVDEHHVVCYLQGNAEAAQRFCENLPGANGTLISCTEVADQNWSAQCAELWKPLTIGSLEILPCHDDEVGRAAGSSFDNIIRIVPGTGFGTGHHASTAMLLELMQSEIIARSKPSRVLDVGTGSGILAIAAAKLFDAQVLATDIDALALENAALNVALNNCGQKVKLSNIDSAHITGSFNLIVANIYAEVLQSLRPDFERLSSPGALLLLSGIMLPLASNLVNEYEAHGWKIQQRLDSSGWVCLSLKGER